jgi:L-2,4-diaminobutyric acid acetyltransferase
MLRELLSRPAVASCRYLETTVAPSNKPSLKLFHRLARDLGAPAARQAMFEEADFGDERHESETLIRIGPFGPNQRQGETPNESRNLRSP